MANSVKNAAGEWSLDEILADVRRMRGNAPSPSGISASDPVDQILAELHAKPAASTSKSRAQGHTHARHAAASTPARQASHASSNADIGVERHRQPASSPREEKADAQPFSTQQHKRPPIPQPDLQPAAKRRETVHAAVPTPSSRPAPQNADKAAAPVPAHRITREEILHDIPPAPAPGKKRANTIFEEMKRQAAKAQPDEQPQEDVIDRKPSAPAQSDRALENKEAMSAPAGNAGQAAERNALDTASTRVDIPLFSSRSKQEKTKILSPKKEKSNRTVDGFTGQVPLPGFDEKPAASDRRQDDIWEKQLREARSKRIQNFVLSGQEEENEPEENLETTDDDDKVVIDDYESLADAPVIRMDLSSRRRSVGLRLGVTLVAEVVLLALSLHTLWIPDLLGNVLTIPVKLVVNALLTAGVILINASSFFGGLGRLFRLSADLDTGAAVALFAALLHNVVMLCVSDAFAASGLYVYNAVAVLAMVCNLWGKFSMIARIERNFELVGNDDPKKAAVLLENSQSAEEIGHGVAFGEPLVCCEKDTVTIRRFLDHSYVQDPADESAQRLSPYILVAGIIGAVLAFFAAPDRSLSLIYAVTALSAVACVCVPAASLLAGNLPLGHACRRLRQQGVLLTGYDAVYDFAYANVLAVNARDLFPKGTIGLHQVKTFGNQSIDRALLDAAGLAIAADGPLASIFDEIIEGQRNILPEVDTLVYEEKMGISGWVSGNRVLIGNRLLMKNHGIALPDENLERRLCKHGQHAVYLATRGSLSAMFVVSYQADERIVEALQKAVDSGLGIAVYSCDPNVTPAMLDQLFGVSKNAVSVMGAAGRQAYQEATAAEGKCDASLAHMGGVENLADGLCACQSLYRSIRLGKGIQIALWVLGLVLSLLLISLRGLSLLNIGIVLAYQGINIALTLLLPVFFRSL